MRTLSEYRGRTRRLDRVNRQIYDALRAMRNGALLRLEYSRWGPDWHLTSGGRLHAEVARAVVADPHVIPVDHALFKGFAAQTWRWLEEK